MNFVFAHMTHLKYFMPLVIEGNKRGIRSKFYTFCKNDKEFEKHKNSDYHPYKHIEDIKKFSAEYDFDFELCRDDKNIKGLTFCGERRGIFNISKGNRDVYRVVLVCLKDFVNKDWYDEYIHVADKVIFPSKFFAEYYGKISDKNMYLGSPKYDIKLDKNEVRKKYNIYTLKNALLLYPHNGVEKTKIAIVDKVSVFLKQLGYTVIVKTKQHHPVPTDLRGDICFEDASWFPHSTMELLEVCNIVINFDSTTVKECIMFDKPFINFHTAPFNTPFRFLYGYKYAANPPFNISFEEFKDLLNKLTTIDLKEEFERSRVNHLFERGGVSSKILNVLADNYKIESV